MLLIDCPHCGLRPELEFRYGGEAQLARVVDPAASSDAQWTEYLYFRRNPRGRHVERWRHVHGCGRFFDAVRDTVSDRFEAIDRAAVEPGNDAPGAARRRDERPP